MLYEIVNPSDKYTMEVTDFTAAAVGVQLLGEGAYALNPIGHDGPKLPILMFGGAKEWIENQIGGALDAYLENPDNLEAIAGELDTILIGGPSERKMFLDMLAAIPDQAKRVEFKARRHEEKCTSLNDIGRRAARMAARMREVANKKRAEVAPAASG